MGMYDDIVCDIPLPFPCAPDDWWQTKSLACGLHGYRITIEGRLLVDAVCPRGDVEAPEPPEDVNGDVVFYGSPAGDDDAWVEYRARLRRGMVEYIDLVEGPVPRGAAAVLPEPVRVWPPGGGRVR